MSQPFFGVISSSHPGALNAVAGIVDAVAGIVARHRVVIAKRVNRVRIGSFIFAEGLAY
jgi:hypothetical protein